MTFDLRYMRHAWLGGWHGKASFYVITGLADDLLIKCDQNRNFSFKFNFKAIFRRATWGCFLLFYSFFALNLISFFSTLPPHLFHLRHHRQLFLNVRLLNIIIFIFLLFFLSSISSYSSFFSSSTLSLCCCFFSSSTSSTSSFSFSSSFFFLLLRLP